jgi:hypothetical protein
MKTADVLHVPLRFPMHLVTHFLLLRRRDYRWQCDRQVGDKPGMWHTRKPLGAGSSCSVLYRASAWARLHLALCCWQTPLSLSASLSVSLSLSLARSLSASRRPRRNRTIATLPIPQARRCTYKYGACVRPCDMTCVNLLVYKSTSAAPPMSAQDRVARKWASFSCKASHQRGCAPPAAEP